MKAASGDVCAKAAAKAKEAAAGIVSPVAFFAVRPPSCRARLARRAWRGGRITGCQSPVELRQHRHFCHVLIRVLPPLHVPPRLASPLQAAVRKACAGVLKVEAGFPVKDDSKREAFEQYVVTTGQAERSRQMHSQKWTLLFSELCCTICRHIRPPVERQYSLTFRGATHCMCLAKQLSSFGTDSPCEFVFGCAPPPPPGTRSSGT